MDIKHKESFSASSKLGWIKYMQERGTVWNPMYGIQPRVAWENLYLSAWWTEHLSRRIQDPGLWTPYPEEAWSKSKLQLPHSCGSGFVCDTNRSVSISVAFVAFPSTSGLLKVCLLPTCPFWNLRGDLAVWSRSVCVVVCVCVYIYITDLKSSSNLNTRMACEPEDIDTCSKYVFLLLTQL